MKKIVTFKDDLTINHASDLIPILDEAIKGNDEVLIDLTDVKGVDTAFLQMLISAKKECLGCGKSLSCTTPESVDRALLSLGIQL